MLLEEVLEVGEAGVAEDLREADQRRGLDAGLLGDLADGADRDVARVLPEEDRDLPQPLGEVDGAGGEDGAQLLVGARPGMADVGAVEAAAGFAGASVVTSLRFGEAADALRGRPARRGGPRRWRRRPAPARRGCRGRR